VFTLFLTPVFYRWIAVWGAEPGMASKRLKRENAMVPEAGRHEKLA
jgi:HAE1 family hydrophobic/amphiphilic exporter-1